MSYRKNPKNYDGIRQTIHPLQNILPSVLKGVHNRYQQRPDLILVSWDELIGEKLGAKTHAESFVDGVLTVRVKNSSLYSLLTQYEKPKLLKRLREKFPKVKIKTIRFRIG